MTDVQRLTGIVSSPQETFADVDRRPTWLFPLIVLALFTLVVNFVVYRVIVTEANFNHVAHAKIDWDASKTGQQLTSQQMDQQIALLHQQRDRWYILPLVEVPISTLGLSVFFLLLLWALRAGPTFPKVFSVVCWSFLIYRVLGGLVTLVALLVRGSQNFYPAPAEAWSPTSLAHLFTRTTVSPHVYSALSKVDIFLIWWLAVMAIGFSKTSRNLTLLRSTLVVVLSEVVYLALNAIGALPGAS